MPELHSPDNIIKLTTHVTHAEKPYIIYACAYCMRALNMRAFVALRANRTPAACLGVKIAVRRDPFIRL